RPHFEGIFSLQLQQIGNFIQDPRELQVFHTGSTSANHWYRAGASRKSHPARKESTRAGAYSDPPHWTQATMAIPAMATASPRPSNAPATRFQRPPSLARAAAACPAQWPRTAGGSASTTNMAGRPNPVGTPPTASSHAAHAPAQPRAIPSPKAAPPSSRAALTTPRRQRRSIHHTGPAPRTASSQFTRLFGLLQQGQELPVLGPQPLQLVGQVKGGQDRDAMPGHVPVRGLQLTELRVHHGRHLPHVLGRGLAPQHKFFVADAHLDPVFDGLGSVGRGHGRASL